MLEIGCIKHLFLNKIFVGNYRTTYSVCQWISLNTWCRSIISLSQTTLIRYHHWTSISFVTRKMLVPCSNQLQSGRPSTIIFWWGRLHRGFSLSDSISVFWGTRNLIALMIQLRSRLIQFTKNLDFVAAVRNPIYGERITQKHQDYISEVGTPTLKIRTEKHK